MLDLVFKAIGALLVFCSILFLAYITSRYIGGKTSKALKGKHISVIETLSLGMDKHLHLIKAGEEFLLISSSGKNIEFLSKIAMDEFIQDITTDDNNTFDFKIFFDKYLQNWKSSREKGKVVELKNIESTEPLGGDVFKNNLNRLRSITKKADSENSLKKEGNENTNDIF